MRKPKYLYHYTSVEALAMILSTKKLKLSPLSTLDDLQEAETADISKIGNTIYVSSWTSDENESIPMWNMYSKMETGVRIKAEVNLFEDYKTEDDGKSWVGEYPLFNDERVLFPPMLTEVIYSDSKNDLFPKIVCSGRANIDQGKLGVYKNTAWEFQCEWRYIVRTWPGLKYESNDKTAEQIYLDFYKAMEPYIFLDIKQSVFETLEITLSPKILKGNKVLY